MISSILTDTYILKRILENPKICEAFPPIRDLAQKFRNAAMTSKPGCSTCSRRNAVSASAISSVRTYIQSLPSPQIQKLKELLGNPGPLIIYQRVNGTQVKLTI